MTDQYQQFTSSRFGQLISKNLGLPTPNQLQRFQSATPVVSGAVLFGQTIGAFSSHTIVQLLKRIHANTFVLPNDHGLQEIASQHQLNVSLAYSEDKTTLFKAVVFDASGIESSQQLQQLYDFFNPIARKIATSGKVLIIGRHPDHAKSVAQAIAQRAIQGFVKSIAKEFKRGITVQLLYVNEQSIEVMESSVRFFISPRSAYVSGQTISVQTADVRPVQWAKPLLGKVAVVTGASRGIGESIAYTLARDGAKVICLDIEQQQSDLHRVADAIQGIPLTLDICASDAAQQLANIAQGLGGLDIVVHNAGITQDKTLANMSPEAWSRVIDINLTAIETINQYLLTHHSLNDHARIICVSSISGISGNLGQSNYATSKAGVIGLVQYTAPTLERGITINAVAPGFIETQMTAKIPFAIREAGRRMNALYQGGQPVDVAEAIAYFATEASSGLNGQVLRVCGQSLLGA